MKITLTRLVKAGQWVGMILLLSLYSNQTVNAQNSVGTDITKVGTTSAQFLKIGVGSRPLSLGGAYVAEANDLSALYWNPAGLAKLKGSAAEVLHTRYLADINYNYAAVGFNMGNVGTIGVGVTFLDSGDMDVRTTAQPEGTGERFKVTNLSIQLSYGKALTDRFSVGGSAKFIREQIWHTSSSSVGFDVGILFTTPYDKLRLGASISNFGPNMQLSGRDILFGYDPDPNNEGNNGLVNGAHLLDSYSLPLIFRVGLAWDAIDTDNYRLLLLTDATVPNDNSQYLNLGAEFSFRNLVFLRGGYKNLFEKDGEQGLTLGGGLNYRIDGALSIRIDYANVDFGRLERTHWFTIGLGF